MKRKRLRQQLPVVLQSREVSRLLMQMCREQRERGLDETTSAVLAPGFAQLLAAVIVAELER